MNFKNNIQRYFFAIVIASCLCSCANIIPPSGGSRDTLAPILIASFPKDSSINFNSKKITLTFNEYVEAKEIQQNLVVNPMPKNQPLIDYKLQAVFITLKDSLEPNTTYTINFGNAIKDVNEGNIAKNKTYVFSTGNSIDNNSITGKVILAKDGKVDSNLTVVLHPNLTDSAVLKLKPKYLVKLNGKGEFKFTNLPKTSFNIFVLPNEYSKKYDDSTKIFAFLNNPILATDSIANVTLYAYKEAEMIERNTTPKQEISKLKEIPKLKYSINFSNNKFDILDSALVISFSKKIKINSLDSILLLDTSYNKIANAKLYFDSATAKVYIKNSFTLNEKYVLIINKNSVTDTLGLSLEKIDTVRFSTLTETDYGSIKIRCKQKIANAVLQIISNGKLLYSYPITTNEIYKKMFKPGDYELRILLDENKNNIWDTGNYKTKKQPEIVIALQTKLLVKANWDNEIEINW